MSTNRVIGDLTNQKFGKYTVLCPADPLYSQILSKDKNGEVIRDENGKPVYKRGKTVYQTWLCRCECGKEVVVKEQDLKRGSAKGLSCGCSNKLKENYAHKKEIDENEQIDFTNLYEYVRKEVMGYSVNMSLTSKMVLRLKGMQDGTKIKNLKTEARAYYPYKVILGAFKASADAIKRANKKQFFTEDLRFNYMCAIAESNLNMVAMRLDLALKAKEELNRVADQNDSSYVPTYTSNYQSKPKQTYDYKGLLDDIT